MNCSGVSALGAVAEIAFSEATTVDVEEDDAGDGFLLDDDDVVYLESFSLELSFSLVESPLSRTDSLSLEEEEESFSLLDSFSFVASFSFSVVR